MLQCYAVKPDLTEQLGWYFLPFFDYSMWHLRDMVALRKGQREKKQAKKLDKESTNINRGRRKNSPVALSPLTSPYYCSTHKAKKCRQTLHSWLSLIRLTLAEFSFLFWCCFMQFEFIQVMAVVQTRCYRFCLCGDTRQKSDKNNNSSSITTSSEKWKNVVFCLLFYTVHYLFSTL